LAKSPVRGGFPLNGTLRCAARLGEARDWISRNQGGSRPDGNHDGTGQAAGQRETEVIHPRHDLSPTSTTTTTHSRPKPTANAPLEPPVEHARQQLGAKLARQRGRAAAEASWASPFLRRRLQASQRLARTEVSTGRPVTPGNLSQAAADGSPRQRPRWGRSTAQNVRHHQVVTN
jgi:hypothetical protein